MGALLPLAPAWPEPHEIPGRNPWEKEVPAVVGHLFPADLFREKSTVTSALPGSSVTAPPSHQESKLIFPLAY